MAGKSSRGRNKKAANTVANAPAAAAPVAPVVVPAANGHPEDNVNPVEEQKVDANANANADANGVLPSVEVEANKAEVKEPESESSENQAKQGKNCLAVMVLVMHDMVVIGLNL